MSYPQDGLPPVEVELDPLDIGTLIGFIDHFLPMVDTAEEDSRDVAFTVFEVRETMHKAMGSLGSEVPKGVKP